MQIVFRHVTDQEFAQPPAGEMILRLRHHTGTPVRAMSQHVLKQGVTAYPQGAAPIEWIVVAHDPTLDDLLAAEIAQRKLAGEDIPAGLGAFAQYAAIAREGLKPGEVPLDCSLEGIFLAMRNEAGADLASAAAGAKMAADWQRLSERIWSAAKAGVDPFTQKFLAEGAEFARERTFLRRDYEVFRQDVERGERWIVQIPDGPPNSLGLLLRKPKSLLFKYWSRDPEAGLEGKPYLFLAVASGPGKWVFSTDPVHRLSLLGLHEKLQAAEAGANAQRANADPWFDGAPFGHTLIAAPKQGSVLNDDQVLKIVSSWMQGKSLRVRKPPVEFAKWAAVTSAGVAVITLVLSIVRGGGTLPTAVPPIIGGSDSTQTPRNIPLTVVDVPISQDVVLRGDLEKRINKLKPRKDENIDFFVNSPTKQPVKFALQLRASNAEDTADLRVQSIYVNEEDQPRYVEMEMREGQWQSKSESEQSALFHAGPNPNKVRVIATNGGGQPVDVQAKLLWRTDTSFLPNLYFLAIGVGGSLPHSVDDALALSEFFSRQDSGLLFQNVQVMPPLVNENASQTAIYGAISELNQKVNVETKNDLVVISISAHGAVVEGQYYLIPAGCDESEQGIKINATAISQGNLMTALGTLAKNCRVLLVLDTCHAAALAAGDRTRSAETIDMSAYINPRLTERMLQNPQGIMILSACLGNQKANEFGKLKHGVLTLAVLEALEGRLLYSPSGTGTDESERFLPPGQIVDLAQLRSYVEQRVKRLTDAMTSHPQSVAVTTVPEISLSDIPLLVRPTKTEHLPK